MGSSDLPPQLGLGPVCNASLVDYSGSDPQGCVLAPARLVGYTVENFPCFSNVLSTQIYFHIIVGIEMNSPGPRMLVLYRNTHVCVPALYL